MHHFSFRPSGIASLPVELLTRIFILGAGYDFPYVGSPFLLKPDQDYYAVPSSNFQLLVSHVCHHWRQIALQTSCLWNMLHFRAPEHLPRAEEYINRCSASGQLFDILVDTVAEPDYLQGVNLFRKEIHQIFNIIIPHLKRWRSFHLKICDHDCKATARVHLGTCGAAPRLETLQLYHFEDYLTVQNLYLATYRPPVVVFSNNLPQLRNVSLIGVNLPWARSPYLVHLHNLELALHPENIRPAYEDWENMLRNSPELQTLSLHYSGPRVDNGETKLLWPTNKERVYIESLENLSLTDLDPDYLCLLMGRLILPGVKRLTLDLPDQDFTPFIELIAGSAVVNPNTSSPAALSSPTSSITPSSPSSTFSSSSTVYTPSSPSLPNIPFPSPARLDTLVISALECSTESLHALFRALEGLRLLEVNFARVGDNFLSVLMGEFDVDVEDSEGDSVVLVRNTGPCPKLGVKSASCLSISNEPYSTLVQRVPLLPRLEVFRMSGLPGEKVESLMRYREGEALCLTRRCGKDEGPCMRYGARRWIVRWSERRRGKDGVLDRLVEQGWVSEDGRVISVETFEDEDDEPEDDDDDDGDGSQQDDDNDDDDEEADAA